MTWGAYSQMCLGLKIKPTKKSWHAYLRQMLKDLQRIMQEEGIEP